MPLRAGATGEAVRDLQRRLAAVGYDSTADELGVFGDGTVGAVRSFQKARGLRVDGVCGRETWSSLVEAGYGLGDRLLYLRQPMLRGDDVAELQRRVGALGFDAGRVDGMFGARTAGAVEDFQRNAGLTVDGVCGPATLVALGRLGSRCEQGRPVVEAVREMERLRDAPRTLAGRHIVVGHAGGLDALVAAVTASTREHGARVTVCVDPDESEQASEANAASGDAFIAVALHPDEAVCDTSYYARRDYESTGGRRLAELVHGSVREVLDVDGEVRGMSLPVLRETRMPAVVIEIGPADRVVERSGALGAAVAAALAAWAADPVD